MTALRAVTEPDVLAEIRDELRELREEIRALGTRDGPPLLDAEAAGELLGVPKSWLLAEARAGRIPHVKLGHYTRFDRAALLDWIDGRMAGPR